ncbi:MAG: PAS domain-containing sensor histidine kinase [Vicinamibacteraceae bacterium]
MVARTPTPPVDLTAWWQAIWDLSPVGLFVSDRAGDCLFSNARFRTIAGLADRSAIGRGWAATLHPDDRERVVGGWAAAAAAGTAFVEEARFVHRDGRVVWTVLQTAEVAAGLAPASRVAFVEDVSVHRRAAELEAARTRELETLLSVTTHDLREPLRALSGIASLVRAEHGERLGSDGCDLLDRLMRGAGRMDALVDAVSTLVRAQAIRPDQPIVDGGVIAGEALRRLRQERPEHAGRIEVQGGFPPLRAHAEWAIQSLVHLLDNALTFGVDGPVTIEGFSAGPDVGFRVSDGGPGVPRHLRDDVFGLFRRGVGRGVPGLGLGLAIVRTVAERHGGRAFVEAGDSGGSVFVVTFGPAPGLEPARP